MLRTSQRALRRTAASASVTCSKALRRVHPSPSASHGSAWRLPIEVLKKKPGSVSQTQSPFQSVTGHTRPVSPTPSQLQRPVHS